MAILLRPPALTVLGVILAIRGFDYFIHMNARISLGPVLASPLSHRIHHSRLEEHVDKDFAAIFPIIDIIFGTWVAPSRRLVPPTGLCIGEEPVRSLADMVVLPFKQWRRLWRDAVARYSSRGDGRRTSELELESISDGR